MSAEVSVEQTDPRGRSVTAILDKIARHNSDVLGCIATDGVESYNNLPEAYELVDAEAMGEYVNNMFAVMQELEASEPDFENLVLEYEGHTIVAKRIEGGALALINNPINRGGLKKMQVGMNLFLNPLAQAMKGPEVAAIRVEGPEAVSAVRDEPAAAPKRRLFGRLRG
ncbi:MAG: hypothetical protein AAF415_11655 [Pseudomonadota bacterium]